MEAKIQKKDKKSELLPIVNISKKVYAIENHSHSVYEIIYIKSGTVSTTVEGKKSKISKGSVIFIAPLEQHKIISLTKKEFEYCSFVFDRSVFGDTDNPCRYFFESIRINRFLNFSDRILNQLSSICAQETIQLSGYEVLQYSLLFEMFSQIIRTKQYEKVSILRQQTKHSISAVDIAIEYIQKNYTDYINLSDILELTSYSKSHFIKLFKETTGMHLTEYINKYRIDRACTELQFAEKNITEIATQNGFNNIQYFSKVFKEYMHCSPKQYQIKIRKQMSPKDVSR